MGRLSQAEITNILLAKRYTPVDISTYQNKQSKITIKCPEGHTISTSLAEVEKASFRCPKCQSNGFEEARISDEVPQKNGYRIVAFDQSSNNIGVSVYDNGLLVYYDWYKLTGELDERLLKWYKLLKETVFNIWKPDHIVFEQIQYQESAGVVTFQILAEVLGIAIMASQEANIPHTIVLSKIWKSFHSISGSTRVTQKRNSMEKVKEIFNINVTDDVADAILIGLWCCRQHEDKWGGITKLF